MFDKNLFGLYEFHMSQHEENEAEDWKVAHIQFYLTRNYDERTGVSCEIPSFEEFIDEHKELAKKIWLKDAVKIALNEMVMVLNERMNVQATIESVESIE